MRKLTATNLKELADELNAIDQKYKDNYYTQEHDPQAVYDSTSLPTFGGEEPEDTLEIYSWDEKNFLRYDDNIGWNITTKEEV